jgi:hypothetical protein
MDEKAATSVVFLFTPFAEKIAQLPPIPSSQMSAVETY